MDSNDTAIVDCETFGSALESMAAILNLPPKRLLTRVEHLDSCEISEFVRESGVISSLVHWFHATRVPTTATFRDGILPLSSILEQIWTFLGSLANDWSTREEWIAFRCNMQGEGARQYKLKVGSPVHQGPFGFLVRPMIFSTKGDIYWNYLKEPEIVHDICLSYQEMFDRPLLDRFINATQPCIVKFLSRESDLDAIEAALRFVQTVHTGEDPGEDCNLFHCGEGKPIKPSAIVAVEWPKL